MDQRIYIDMAPCTSSGMTSCSPPTLLPSASDRDRGSSGIGRATVLAAVAAGAKATVADVDERGGHETVAMAGGGAHADYIRTDVVDAAGAGHSGRHARSVRAARLRPQQRRYRPRRSLTAEIPVDDWQRVIDVDLTGVWNCMRAEIPVILDTGRGSIVNTSSGLWLVGIARQAAYVTAKHGVIGRTRAAALEYSAARSQSTHRPRWR